MNRAETKAVNLNHDSNTDATGKTCRKCGQKIAEYTLMGRPDTKYCGEHIDLNTTLLPTQDLLGSREQHERETGRNKYNG